MILAWLAGTLLVVLRGIHTAELVIRTGATHLLSAAVLDRESRDL